MKEIRLSKGGVALVDDEDFGRLNLHRRGIYAVRGRKREDGSWTSLAMHREVFGAKSGTEVDHLNGNGCDNRKINLRIATRKENCRNRGTHINNKPDLAESFGTSRA